jgi:hypothetical protein
MHSAALPGVSTASQTLMEADVNPGTNSLVCLIDYTELRNFCKTPRSEVCAACHAVQTILIIANSR